MYKNLYYDIEKDRNSWITEEERKDMLKHIENHLSVKFTAER